MLTVPIGNTKEVLSSLHLHLKFQPFSYSYFLSMNIFFYLNTSALNLINCQCNCRVRMQGVVCSFPTGLCFSCDHWQRTFRFAPLSFFYPDAGLLIGFAVLTALTQEKIRIVWFTVPWSFTVTNLFPWKIKPGEYNFSYGTTMHQLFLLQLSY